MPTPPSVTHAQLVVQAYGVQVRSVAPLGRGLINDTFAVEADEGRFVLQRVNPVFAPEIHHNIAAVTEHLRGHGLATPRLRPDPDGRLFITHEDRVWRLMTREPGVSVDAVSEPGQAHAAAALLGRFHSALADLDHTFVGLRTGVHDTPVHLARLREAVEEHTGHRLFDVVAPLAAAIIARAETLPPLGGLPDRVVHGDPKLNNVLFAGTQGEAKVDARCWIDLDTVAPMPLAVELGDAWRSWCNPRGEDEDTARFDLEIFGASLRGYAQGCSLTLQPEEREALLHGVEWITLELAARFAADALREDYFGWDRAKFPAAGEHNLVRAQGQWSLHEAAMAVRGERLKLLRACGFG